MAKNHIKITAKVARHSAAYDRRREATSRLERGAHDRRAHHHALLPDDYLQLANPLWSARGLRGRVVEVRRETVDSATLVIKPGWGFSFDYQPGQYIGIGLLVDGRWRWRSYSLTSSPVKSDRVITITVKAMPEGFLSTHLVGGVAPGTIVRLAAPQGNFVMPDPAPAAVLFVTAGSGITPVMSMLRTLARRKQITDVVHLHSAPTEADVMFATELANWCATQPGYRLRLRSTRTAGPPRYVAAGRRGARLAGAADLGLRARGHAQRRRAGMVGRRHCRAAAFGAIRRIPRRARTDRAAPSNSPGAASEPWRTPRRH